MQNLRLTVFVGLLVASCSGERVASPDAGVDLGPSDEMGNEDVLELRIDPIHTRVARLDSVHLEPQAYWNGYDVPTPIDEVEWEFPRNVEHLGRGEFAARIVGVASINAKFGEYTGSATIVVDRARVNSIRLRPGGTTVLGQDESLEFDYELYSVDRLQFSEAEREETEVVFTSTNPSVASVTPYGVVTGHATGEAEIVVEADGASAKAKVQVYGLEATTFEIEGLRARVVPGTKHAISLREEWAPNPPPEYQIIVESSNESVLSIDPTTFEATSHAEGTTTVTASVPGYPTAITSLDVAVTNRVTDFAVTTTALVVLVDGIVYRIDTQSQYPYFRAFTSRLFEFSAIDGGLHHYCLLHPPERKVACAGYNVYHGQTGSNDVFTLTPMYLSRTGAVSITVDGLRSCFETTNGDDFCWGAIFPPGYTTTPTLMGYEVFTQSERHYCEIRSMGLHCAGVNDQGQLGLGTVSPTGSGNIVTTEVFVSLVSGDRFTCGLNASGTTLCWGDGDSGQIGNGQFADVSTPQPVSGQHSFTEIAAGAAHVCGLDVSGNVWCWGANDRGQLGDGTNVSRAEPTAIASNDKFTTIDGSANTTCGLESVDRDVWCWGADFNTNVPLSTAVRGPF